MNRQEAISRLRYWLMSGTEGLTNNSLGYAEGWFDKRDKAAFEMAISSLETDEAYQLEYEQPEFCADCISRKEVFETLGNILGIWGRRALMEIPSVYPKSDAIPRERIEQMKNEFIRIGEGSGWLDISLHHCLEIIDKYTKEHNEEDDKCACYYCKHFHISGWSHCKLHEWALGDSRCNDYEEEKQ